MPTWPPLSWPLLREPAERRRRVDHWERSIGRAAWIACDQGVATAGFGGRRADGILEIWPGQRERASDVEDDVQIQQEARAGQLPVARAERPRGTTESRDPGADVRLATDP